MRLKSVFISEYKNLKDFALDFEGEGFIDIFVGKNGSGKSNFLEALIEIFDHVYGFSSSGDGPGFYYRIAWDIDGTETRIGWQDGQLSINGKPRKQIGSTPLPENIIVYYSGQNDTVAGLIRRYRESYRRSVRKAVVAESPRFVGIGPDYKTLLVALMLMLPEDAKARQFLCRKLGIEVTGGEVWLKLRRPGIAAKTKFYDPFENDQLFWGTKGIARSFLEDLMRCIVGDFTPGSLYDRASDTYRFVINIDKFREVFEDRRPDEVFGLFNALRALGMFEDISIPLRLSANVEVSSRAFSDGQFQSVYLYAISELFKNRNCITLLDEPDAFLHPEWQSDFLAQTLDISEEGARTNHILMTSHSASTVAAKAPSRLRQIEFNGERTEACKYDKSDLIKSLSAGLITFSEKEARLNITHNLKNTRGPVLFTEGVSDEVILEKAWSKLYPDQDRPFEIQATYGCGFLGALLREETIYANHPERCFFGVFDFDEAYNNWNSRNTDFVQQDPAQGLVRKKQGKKGYFALLPVPAKLSVRNQVINPANGQHYKDKSLLPIELLFHDVPSLDDWFCDDEARPGNFRKFRGSKTDFASKVIPGLEPEHFECFRPLFEFVERTIGAA